MNFINEPDGDSNTGEANERPRRTRNPPDRFGFMGMKSFKDVVLILKERVPELEIAHNQQQERIKRLKPQWLGKAAKLKRNRTKKIV